MEYFLVLIAVLLLFGTATTVTPSEMAAAAAGELRTEVADGFEQAWHWNSDMIKGLDILTSRSASSAAEVFVTAQTPFSTDNIKISTVDPATGAAREVGGLTTDSDPWAVTIRTWSAPGNQMVLVHNDWSEKIDAVSSAGQKLWQYKHPMLQGSSFELFELSQHALTQPIVLLKVGPFGHFVSLDSKGSVLTEFHMEEHPKSIALLTLNDGTQELICHNDSGISRYSAEGTLLGTIPFEAEVMSLDATKSDSSGPAQLLVRTESDDAERHSPAILSAIQMDGSLLWSRNAGALTDSKPRRSAAYTVDTDKDGVLEWIVQTGNGTIEIIDDKGQTLAKLQWPEMLEDKGSAFRMGASPDIPLLWSVAETQDGLIVAVATTNGLTGYRYSY